MAARSAEVAPDIDDEAPFELANLAPEQTGLPMIVWVSEQGPARHDARVKVSLVHGRRARPDQTVSVSVRPTIDIVAGAGLDRHDLGLVRRWVELNRDVILDYWNGTLLTVDLFERLQPVS